MLPIFNLNTLNVGWVHCFIDDYFSHMCIVMDFYIIGYSYDGLNYVCHVKNQDQDVSFPRIWKIQCW